MGDQGSPAGSHVGTLATVPGPVQTASAVGDSRPRIRAESKRKRGMPRESAAGQFDSQIRQAGRLYANWAGPKVWIEYERLANAVGLWRGGDGRLSRDRAREIAVRLGTELTQAELDRLYDAACEFKGQEWKYSGTDAGGLWMVASGLPADVRLAFDGIRADVVERVKVARGVV